MPLVTMRQLLDEAAAGGYGVGAYNVNNMEQIQRIMEAARSTASPVIAQASRGARKHEQFGTAGHAGDYVPLSLDEMRGRYAAAAASGQAVATGAGATS